MRSIIQAVVPRPRDDGGSVLRDVLAGEDYDLSETASGVNALWIVSAQFCDTSLAEAEALLNAARGFVLTENSFRMLVYCHQVDGQLSTSSSEGDGRHRFVDSAGAHANLWQNFNFPAYSEDDLRRPAWRWAMSGEVAKKAASELGLAVNMVSSRQAPAGTLASHTADSNPTVSTETEQPTCDWTLFVVGADGLMLVPMSVDHRHLLVLADMAQYDRRMAFSGLWMACRAGNQALLDLMLRAGTPWAAAVRRAFTLGSSCDDDDDAENPFESKGEFVQGEVWREMDLPQRFNSCGQAALMSANVGLVKALEAHVGRDAFWANCRSADASDFHDSVAHYAGKFDALGLLTRKRMPSEGDSSEPSAKRQATAGTADHELSPESRRLYGWGMAQAIATHVFIRESEEPRAGSITTSVRYARGDLKCKDQDLHGPRVFERSIDVLKLIDARARDDPVVTELLREPSIINLMYRFASPFYYAVESGNQAAFAYISAQLAEVVDANFDVDQTKLGTDHPVKASELVKGFFAELDIIQGGTRSGAIRSPLWYGVVAQYRYGKAPDWGGGRSLWGGPHGGGPDPNAFPREFNKELWYHEVVLELVRCVSLLHPHLGLRDGENPVPGPLRETMCQEKDAWFPAVQTWLSSQRPVCARASSQSFWETFFLRLWCRHGFLGIKQLALVGSGSKFEIDWDLFLA